MVPRHRRRGRWWRRLEVMLAALLVALLGAYLLAARELFLQSGSPLAAWPGADATPEALAARPVEVASLDAAGTALGRGDPARTGLIDGSGPRRVLGLRWIVPTGGQIVAEPVVADG